MALDLNLFRKDKGNDPQLIYQSEKNRYKNVAEVDKVIKLDAQHRAKLKEINYLRATSNKLQNQLSSLYKKDKSNPDILKLQEERGNLLAEIEQLENENRNLEKELGVALKAIGNILKPTVPLGANEDSNVTRKLIEPIAFVGIDTLPHDEILHKIDGVDKAAGSAIAGHRGYFLKNEAFLLAQALSQYALSFLIERGYSPIQPPYFMTKAAIRRTCQLSDFEETLYTLENTLSIEEEQKMLIATSEQPISCLFMDQILPAQSLPLRFAGYSSCFRKEAGSGGKDTRGIFRVHQFEKIEQFIYCEPERSDEELEKMVLLAEEFLASLELAFRSVFVASGELNDAAAVKVDIEGWFPAQKTYRELMSCSNCTDFQSREVNVRVRIAKSADKFFPHLLNGTLCAVQRTLCCLVENNQVAEGVKIPEVLKKFYLGKNKDLIKYIN